MNEILVPYIERYQDFINTENVGTTRRILKTLRVIAPKKAALGEAVSKYLRILDDAVDEEVFVRPVKSLLIDERDGLLSGRPTGLQDALISPLLAQLPDKQSERLRQNLSRIMYGQLMDIDSRLTQSPLSSSRLVTRNFITCWSVISAFCIGALDVEPTASKDSVRLMNAWGSYDCLIDLESDLTCGLVLIDRDNLQKYGLRFTDGDVLPKHELTRYYTDKVKQTKDDFIHYSNSMFKAGLPPWFAITSYIYFRTRTQKIPPSFNLNPSAIYRTPLDCA